MSGKTSPNIESGIQQQQEQQQNRDREHDPSHFFSDDNPVFKR